MPTAKEYVDVLVIGSGASGGPVAFELAKSGIKVMVLEKGDWCPRDTQVEDELSQLHREIYRPSGDMDPTVIKSKGKVVAETSRLGQAFYLVGGGTVRYSGTSWRMRTDDFRKLSKYGAVDGTNLADWPISYDELEPYYTKAEEEIGISGLAGDDPTEPYRSRNVLMPPLASDNWQDRLSKASRKLGWKPFHIPLALHSQANARTGAAPCMQCGWCSGFPCLFRAKSSVDIVIYPRAQETGNFTLRTKAYATQIKTDDSGKVQGVEYINTETGETEFVGCKVLVLATSAIQTTRLMLLSTSNRFPKGLANENDILGRNLMFHIECKASATFDDVYNQHLYKKTGVHDFYFPKKTDSFINHRSLQAGSKSSPIAFGLSRKGYGAALEKDIKENFLRTQEVQCMVEDLPQLDNRVVLSDTKKDPWGVPAPEVHHAYHDMDKRAAAAANERIRDLMVAAGGEDIRIPDVHDNVSGRYSWHLMGTARMGKDPATSVLNSDCRAHSVSNLYIVDGSPFTTSIGLNPSLTMQALSFRTADKIKQALKEGSV
jgi:choline dehydrogenase-like flavoprotein